MEKQRPIGVAAKNLSNQIKREIDRIAGRCGIEGMTGMHQMIIGYIGRHSESHDFFQKDLEKRFNMRRSTATGILQLMEKNDLIKRIPVDYDARLKKIVLTQKALEIHQKCQHEIDLMEQKLRKDLTDDEIDTFFMLIDKIISNVE